MKRKMRPFIFGFLLSFLFLLLNAFTLLPQINANEFLFAVENEPPFFEGSDDSQQQRQQQYPTTDSDSPYFQQQQQNNYQNDEFDSFLDVDGNPLPYPLSSRYNQRQDLPPFNPYEDVENQWDFQPPSLSPQEQELLQQQQRFARQVESYPYNYNYNNNNNNNFENLHFVDEGQFEPELPDGLPPGPFNPYEDEENQWDFQPPSLSPQEQELLQQQIMEEFAWLMNDAPPLQQQYFEEVEVEEEEEETLPNMKIARQILLERNKKEDTNQSSQENKPINKNEKDTTNLSFLPEGFERVDGNTYNVTSDLQFTIFKRKPKMLKTDQEQEQSQEQENKPINKNKKTLPYRDGGLLLQTDSTRRYDKKEASGTSSNYNNGGRGSPVINQDGTIKSRASGFVTRGVSGGASTATTSGTTTTNVGMAPNAKGGVPITFEIFQQFDTYMNKFATQLFFSTHTWSDVLCGPDSSNPFYSTPYDAMKFRGVCPILFLSQAQPDLDKCVANVNDIEFLRVLCNCVCGCNN